MVGHGAKFGRKQEAAIGALLTQRNVHETARVASIGIQTLYRWLKLQGMSIVAIPHSGRANAM